MGNEMTVEGARETTSECLGLTDAAAGLRCASLRAERKPAVRWKTRDGATSSRCNAAASLKFGQDWLSSELLRQHCLNAALAGASPKPPQ